MEALGLCIALYIGLLEGAVHRVPLASRLLPDIGFKLLRRLDAGGERFKIGYRWNSVDDHPELRT